MHPKIDRVDLWIGHQMERYGHVAHRLSLALLFFWFGLLKIFGEKTGSSLLAHTIYWGSPETMVPVLGMWELLIGVSLAHRKFIRIALALLAVRLPGTFLALVLQSDVCFAGSPFVPTPEGQYLIKDLILFSAAMVIGGTVREERAESVIH